MPSQDTRISFLQNPWPPCKEKHLSLQNGCAQRQKIMFKVGWPPSFCREKPSTKWWWPASYTRIFLGSGSFHLFLVQKNPKTHSHESLARIPRLSRTKPSIDSHEALVHLIRSPLWYIYKKYLIEKRGFPSRAKTNPYKMIWPLIDLQKAVSQAMCFPLPDSGPSL